MIYHTLADLLYDMKDDYGLSQEAVMNLPIRFTLWQRACWQPAAARRPLILQRNYCAVRLMQISQFWFCSRRIRLVNSAALVATIIASCV